MEIESMGTEGDSLVDGYAGKKNPQAVVALVALQASSGLGGER